MDPRGRPVVGRTRVRKRIRGMALLAEATARILRLRDRYPILHDFLKRQLPGFKVHLLGPRIECHGALRAESRGWVVPAHRMPAMARQARHCGAASLLNLSEIPETRQLFRCLHA